MTYNINTGTLYGGQHVTNVSGSGKVSKVIPHKGGTAYVETIRGTAYLICTGCDIKKRQDGEVAGVLALGEHVR